MASLEDRLQRLEDRLAIEDCLKRYCRGLDRLDVELCKSAYHEDAKDDHGTFIGRGHELVEWANAGHAKGLDGWQHYITNILVELEGDSAHAETYWVLGARKKDSYDSWLGGGRYVDRFERRDGRWAIAARLCTCEWNTDAATMESLLRTTAPISMDRDDPSYQRPFEVSREPRSIDSWAEELESAEDGAR